MPCPQAVDAVRDADWVVLGPGSWFTSVIPHLLVPELCRAVVETRGRVVVVLNLAPQAGETPGFEPADHLAALLEHAPDLRIHTVLADVRSVPDRAALEDAVAAPVRGWWWPTSARPTARRATTPASSPRPTPR